MSLKKSAKIAGLIIAAGGSSRLDSPKQLLKWGDTYLINHCIGVVTQAEIHSITVVLGSRTEEIRAVLPLSGGTTDCGQITELRMYVHRRRFSEIGKGL